jgi:hypothetical protein
MISPASPATSTVSAVPRRTLRTGTITVVTALASLWSGAAVGGAPPSPTCIDGWTSPDPGTALYEEGLGILSGFFALSGLIEVAEIRYFTGPEVPWVFDPPSDVVRRWYLKVALVDDPEWRGRFILEWRTDLINGVSAAAPYDTTGYQSPDWRAFVGEGPFRVVPGLPGLWSGIEYDFVTGEGDTGNPGLPAEVEGCLAADLPATT